MKNNRVPQISQVYGGNGATPGGGRGGHFVVEKHSRQGYLDRLWYVSGHVFVRAKWYR